MERAYAFHKSQAAPYQPATRFDAFLHDYVGEFLEKNLFFPIGYGFGKVIQHAIVPVAKALSGGQTIHGQDEVSKNSGEASTPGPNKEGKPTKSKLATRLREIVKQQLKSRTRAAVPKRQAVARARPSVMPSVPAVKARARLSSRTAIPDTHTINSEEELIGPVVPTADAYQVLYNLPISPGNQILCPVGQNYANMYEEFTVDKIEFKYYHSVGTNVSGDLYMVVDTDPEDAPPTSAQMLYSNKIKKAFAPYDDASLVAVKSNWTTKTNYTTIATATSGTQNANDRFNFPGVFYLCADHVTAAALNSSLGRLTVKYTITFRKRKSPQPVSWSATSTSLAFVGPFTAANQYASFPTSTIEFFNGMLPTEMWAPNPTTPTSVTASNAPIAGGRRYRDVGQDTTLQLSLSLVISTNTCAASTVLGFLLYNPSTQASAFQTLTTVAGGATPNINVAQTITVSSGFTHMCLAAAGQTNTSGQMSFSANWAAAIQSMAQGAPEVRKAIASRPPTDAPTVYSLPQNLDAVLNAVNEAADGTTVAITPPTAKSVDEVEKRIVELVRAALAAHALEQGAPPNLPRPDSVRVPARAAGRQVVSASHGTPTIDEEDGVAVDLPAPRVRRT